MVQNIYIVRHGLSMGNIDKSLYETTPDYAIPLAERGFEQAKNAGIQLNECCKNPVVLISSPYFRARQTRDAILDTDFSKKVVVDVEDVNLREQEWKGGSPQPFNWNLEKERGAISTFYYRFPGGESGADVYNRVSLFTLDKLARINMQPDAIDVVIVSHGYTIRVLLMKLLHLSVEEFELMRNPKNCQIIHLEMSDTGVATLKSELDKRKKLQHNYIYDYSKKTERE